ncbi:hypothetical protein JD844_008008 [Phrynosoma platyrhinos]|uniref:D-beta-hydroxybutyrate dehydrogenase, mitochondrial n=1 Tax=Phrynosoma platyrhinos TaxID=52577 RepID=A0ABQ7T491_PHRPL|nr:hypothetical protein JD844_008008 [Phrynosoma platyrhinos]
MESPHGSPGPSTYPPPPLTLSKQPAKTVKPLAWRCQAKAWPKPLSQPVTSTAFSPTCRSRGRKEGRKGVAEIQDPLEERSQQTPGLWGLVNNAGVASFGDVEFTGLERYQQVAEVNLWGSVRVTKAFLPLIRRARGRVVNMTSMLGRMASPLRSSYCISKFGLEAFTDCLRQEMYPWGVSVVAIEPSNFIAATGILTAEGVEAAARQMWDGAGESVRADYGEAYFQQQVDRMKAFVHSGLSDISPVLEDVTDALSARFPYARYNPMEIRWWVRLQAVTHLPTMLTDWLYIK